MSAHGTRAAYLRGCKCDDCRAAHTSYCKRYKHQAGVDTNRGADHHAKRPIRLPVGDLAEHIAALYASGWTQAAIAREADVSHATLRRLTRGQRRVHPSTAAALLALQPLTPVDVDPVVVERLVDGADWRAIGATRAERIAAAEHFPVKADAERHLSLRAGRDFAVREQVAS